MRIYVVINQYKNIYEKYIDDIMPKITSTGSYISSQEEMKKINELNQKIDKLKEKVTNLSDENNFLDSKHRKYFLYNSL